MTHPANASEPRRHNWGLAAGVIVAGILVALAIVTFVRPRGGAEGAQPDDTGTSPASTEAATTVPPSTTSTVPPTTAVPTLAVGPQVTIPPGPDGLAYDSENDTLWVAFPGGGQLLQYGASNPTGAPVPSPAIQPGTDPYEAAYADGSLWVTLRAQKQLLKVDPVSGELIDDLLFTRNAGSIAVDDGALWLTLLNLADPTLADSAVARIDIGSGALTHDPQDEVAVPSPGGIAAGDGSAWVAQRTDNQVWQIESGTTGPAVGQQVTVDAGPDPVAVEGDVVWVGNRSDGTVSRVDLAVTPEPGVSGSERLCEEPVDLLVDGDGLWVLCKSDGQLLLVDPTTLELRASIAVGSGAQNLVRANDGTIWIDVAGPDAGFLVPVQLN